MATDTSISAWRGKEESRIFIIDLENWSLKRCTNEVVVGKWIKRSIKHLRKTAKTKRKKNKQKNEQRKKHSETQTYCQYWHERSPEGNLLEEGADKIW